MGVQVGKLYRNRKIKDLNGNIKEWFDEADGGWIVKDGVVVNMERWNREVAKEKDRAEAAKAAANPKIREDYPESKDGAAEPDKVTKLEKRVDAIDDKLEAILKAVQK